MPTCKGCGAKLEWIVIDGKRIPLDARKHPIYVPCTSLSPGDIQVWIRKPRARISHFATCPMASTFSKSKRKEPSRDEAPNDQGS